LLWLLIPVLLFLLYQIVFRRRKRRSDRAGAGLAAGVAWPGLDSEFYRIEQKLAALGFERRPGEAAAHWLERASEGGVPSHLRAGLRGLLTLHYRYRFDPQGLPPDSRESLRSQARACLEKLN
jgi:hypothetical protein